MSRPLRHLSAHLRYDGILPPGHSARSIAVQAGNSASHRSSLNAQPRGSTAGDTVSPAAYLRDSMDRSPVRKCIVTRQDLPSDYLVRFIATPEPSSTPQPPDNPRLILTPRTATPRLPEPRTGVHRRKGLWVSCRNDAVESLSHPGPHLAIMRHIPNLTAPVRIARLVELQLRDRVFYELEQLARLAGGRRESTGAQTSRSAPVGGHRVLQRMTSAQVQQVFPVGGGVQAEEGSAEVMAVLDISGLGPATVKRDSPTPLLSHLADDNGVPYFALIDLFPAEQHSRVLAAIDSVLSPDATDSTQRPARGRKEAEAGDALIAVQSWRSAGAGGMKGVSLIKALLRLAMWSGKGWISPSDEI